MQRIKNKISRFAGAVKSTCKSKRGEVFVGFGVKMLIAVVIGALLLGGTYTLAKTGVLEPATNKVRELFDFGSDSVVTTQETETEIIPFSIAGVGEFQVEDGMTWADWIQSYQISSGDNGIVWVDPNTLELCVDIGNGLWVNYISGAYYCDQIIAGMTYEISGPM